MNLRVTTFARPPAWRARLGARPALADLPAVGGGLAVAAGIVVLIGWLLGVDGLKSMAPGLLTMKANTAVCFTLMGTGVVLLSRFPAASRERTLGLALVATSAALAAVTLGQSITGANLGIDQALFREPAGQVGTTIPGRMSPLTSICFTLVGIGALAAFSARPVVIATSAVALTVSVLNIFDFMFNAAVPSFLAGSTQMALNTSVVMGILALAVMALLGQASPLAPVTGASPTAALWRRLLMVSIVVPVVLAWLRLEGQQLGLYDTSYGTSLFLVGVLALGVAAILRSARWATVQEARREASEIERDRFFELSLDMLSVIDADARFRRVNGAWRAVLGYHTDELIGRSFLDLVHPDDLQRTIDQSSHLYAAGERVEAFENRYRHRDGTYRWLEWMSQTSPDRSLSFAVARDVTERKRREDRQARRERMLASRNEALIERAVRDPLTGLHNRRYFDAAVARLERTWNRGRTDQTPTVSMILFDLDHFGEVNKRHGHQAGDAVLRVFAGLLKDQIREKDLLARYGGEEFVAVLEGATAARAIQIAESVRAALEATSIDVGTEAPLRVTVSAGCAQLGEDRSASAGLSLADVWLSQAKRAGRNQVVGL